MAKDNYMDNTDKKEFSISKNVDLESLKKLAEIEFKAEVYRKQNDCEKLELCVDDYLSLENLINDKSKLYYDIGLLYSYLEEISPNVKNEDNRSKRIFYYRKAIMFLNRNEKYRNEFDLLKLYTNYANVLADYGRPISACRYYRYALTINNEFKMAQGNYGICLHTLANYANQKYGSNINVDSNAYRMINDSYLHPDQEVLLSGSGKYFKYWLEDIKYNKVYFKLVSEFKLKKIKENLSKYEEFCIDNHLCLNVENEIDERSSYYLLDDLYVPNLKNEYCLMLQQLVEDYAYCREKMYMLSENNKKTITSQDFRSIYCILYSIMDKCSYFINLYYKIGILKRQVSAKTIISNNKFKDLAKNNKIIEGIYYILQEFDEKYNNDFYSFFSMYKDINELRNVFEHRFVFIIENDSINDGSVGEGNIAIKIKDASGFLYELLLVAREIIINLYISLINDNCFKN